VVIELDKSMDQVFVVEHSRRCVDSDRSTDPAGCFHGTWCDLVRHLFFSAHTPAQLHADG